MRKCSECQREITTGKYYSLFAGKKGGKGIIKYFKSEDNWFFCPACADQEIANPTGYWTAGDLIKAEWEVGNKIDEEIIEFEKKWNHCFYEIACRRPGGRIGETSFTLDFIQKIRKELEPYLQKLEVVEQSFGGKIKGFGVIELSNSYVFARSARNENYRKTVVGPTLAEILGGGDPNQEINTVSSSVTNPSDAQGSTRGIWKVNDKVSIPYIWNDNEGGDCRYISFNFRDHKLALQSLCRALKIKEKELGGEFLKLNHNQPNPNENKNNNSLSPPPPLEKRSTSNQNQNASNNPLNLMYALWISLSIGGLFVIGTNWFIFCKKN